MTEIRPPVIVGLGESGDHITLDQSALTGDPRGPRATGGTYRMSYRHVTSAPLAYNASAEEQAEAVEGLHAADEELTAAHKANPREFADCPVCFPKPVTLPRAERRRRWWTEARRRIQSAYWALRGEDIY